MVFAAADDICSEGVVKAITRERGVRLTDRCGVVTWYTSGQIPVAKGQLGKRLVKASGVCVNMTSPVEAMDVGSHGRLSCFERCGWSEVRI